MCDGSDPLLIAAVRGLIWDPPRWITAERLGLGDDRRTAFQLAEYPISADSLVVTVDGTDATDDLTLDPTLGLVTFAEAPLAGELIEADYAATLLADAAIASQLEAHHCNPLLAAARCLEVLLLDPVAVAGLKLEGASYDPGRRHAAITEAIARYRQAGSYSAFQVRVDAPEWGDA